MMATVSVGLWAFSCVRANSRENRGVTLWWQDMHDWTIIVSQKFACAIDFDTRIEGIRFEFDHVQHELCTMINPERDMKM